MAKAAKIPPSVAEKHPQQWFAEAMRVRFQEVLKFLDAALDATRIDGVHDIRVAIRRLRSLIRDFAGFAQTSAPVKLSRSLRSVADRLGRVRDLDVLIEALERFERSAPDPVAPGLALLIGGYRKRRSRALSSFETAVSEKALTALKAQLETACLDAVRQPGLFDSPSVRKEASRSIGENLERFRSKSDALYRPTAAKSLHRLRIDAKRLRYSLETHASHLGDELTKFAFEVKKMQGHLGDLHDRDVWIDEVRTEARRKSAKSLPDIRKAASWLIAQFSRERNKSYIAALELWSGWEDSGFFEKLKTAAKDTQ